MEACIVKNFKSFREKSWFVEACLQYIKFVEAFHKKLKNQSLEM